jgi:hypothetical protein
MADTITETQQSKITYQGFTERHQFIMTNEIEKMKNAGIDYELNYKVAFTTWAEIRRARGMIMQSVLSKEDLKREYVEQNVERKLNPDEIDRLCNLTTLATLNCGVLFWTRGLDQKNKLLEANTRVLEKMRELTGEVNDPDEYSRFGNAQVMYTFNDFLLSYYKTGTPKTDNLGEHFQAGGESHTFLDGISISDLKNKAKDGRTIVVLTAAASSGVIEAGIFAHYMNTMLSIPTTVDPVFFTKGYEKQKNIMNRVVPGQRVISIPMDDRLVGSGYSPKMAKEAAREKYGNENLIMSRRMKQL